MVHLVHLLRCAKIDDPLIGYNWQFKVAPKDPKTRFELNQNSRAIGFEVNNLTAFRR